VEVPTALAAANIPNLIVGEECWKSDLEATSAINMHLDSAVARIQLEAMATTWKVA
jgi:hypothetical protein